MSEFMKGRFLFSVSVRERKRLAENLKNELDGILMVHVKNLDSMGVEIEIRSGFIDFTEYYKADIDLRVGYQRDLEKGFVNINHHHLEKYFFGEGLSVLLRMMDIVNTIQELHPIEGEKYMIDVWLGQPNRPYKNIRYGRQKKL